MLKLKKNKFIRFRHDLKRIKQFYQEKPLSLRMSWSISIFSIFLLIFIGVAAYRIALEESQEVIDRQMQEMAEFLDKNSLSLRLSTYDPNAHYDETDVFIDIIKHDQLNPLSQHYNYILPYSSTPYFTKKKTTRGELRIYIYPANDKQIQISQLIKVRRHLAKELAFNMLIPYIFFMPFAIYGMYLLIRHHLRKLTELRTTFSERDYNDLSEIQIENLPIEIRPAIDELNYLFKRIEQAKIQQQVFIANAAHELRTPLTALKLQTSLLLKTPQDSQIYDENLSDLSLSLKRMTHLVDQLMSLAHQEVHQDEPLRSLNLVAHIRLCVGQLLANARKKDIELQVNIEDDLEEISILATTNSLHSILINLIDNAIKYSPQQGQVIILLSQDTNAVYVDIHDNGPGISEQEYDHVLERFVRLEHTQQQAIGSGLGLSIVQSALDSVDAKMQFKPSQLLGGLCVHLTFKHSL
ncbi:two-component system OmpR family sensor kinase [Acinetobacter baylyi]|uniref:histidine kinase n=2 Tax=Acinetobacter baylyi TaxID=202950 RepID=A0ABU0UTI2_ACIBI|nr:two-component system OmpR family sensor kinase [Acinetobacter baylyi]MDR6105068.1 two-component system OmpR family sensor kinase [Acinetobacter baylyi]MDR6184724.1 two-component system OmpR family sensor kinase [Acinetobacter baylyi]